ncbi:hypothetical protein [Streptomyces tendae]|uniref:hypothetical protein n=1 Tax=Streptomyces tendae TaxID=1932 RepID=UPI0038103F11
MSARDDLFHRLVVEGGLNPHWANRQIDAFAHELAEEQRAFVKEEGVPTGDDPYIVGVGDVIDLIDPRVGPARPVGEPTP